jgi:hypothetical protein
MRERRDAVSEQSTEKIYFEIGVGQDPRMLRQLEALAKRVEDMQGKMLRAIDPLEQSAKVTGATIESSTKAIEKMTNSAREHARVMRSSYDQESIRETLYTAPPTAAPSYFESPRMGGGASAINPPPNSWGGVVPTPVAPTAQPEWAQKLALSEPSLPDEPEEMNTSQLHTELRMQQESLAEHVVEIGNMTNQQNKALEDMAKAGVKAAKGLIDVGKGLVYIGLVSEESSHKLMQGMAATEGVVNVLKGGIDVAESLGKGATGVKALLASASAARSAGTATLMTTSVAGVGVGVAGTFAAAAAALGSVALAAQVVREQFNGTADEAGSLTRRIAEWESGIVNWIGKATGLFDWQGDVATEKAQERSDEFKIENQRQEAVKTATLDKESSLRIARLEAQAKQSRLAVSNQSNSGQLIVEESILAKAITEYERVQTKVAELQAKGAEGSVEYVRAMKDAEVYAGMIEQSAAATSRLTQQSGKDQVDAAKKVADAAQRELDTRKKMLDVVNEQRMTAAERFASLDDMQKASAIEALKTARTRGGASLTDEQKSLLRSVGGNEAARFAREGDLAEARAFGFDTSFGTDFNKERVRLESERSSFEAVIKDQSNIVINIEARNDALLAKISQSVQQVFRDNAAVMNKKIEETAAAAIQKANQDSASKLRISRENRR